MTEPAKYNPRVTPAVLLNEKMWPVPKLTPRQMRHIYHQLMVVTDAINAGEGNTFGDRVVKLTNEHFEQATQVVYWGLTNAHPTLTEDEFLDMPITPVEMLAAFLIVRSQTGLFKAADAPKAAQEGGTQGEANGPNQIGTASSQEPADISTARRTIGKTRSPGTGSKRKARS